MLAMTGATQSDRQCGRWADQTMSGAIRLWPTRAGVGFEQGLDNDLRPSNATARNDQRWATFIKEPQWWQGKRSHHRDRATLVHTNRRPPPTVAHTFGTKRIEIA